ncbi:MAG: hypothetical protein ACP5LM_02420 [Thermoplasmata archaeon]
MKKIFAYLVVMILGLVAFIPLSHASYLNIYLYPDKKMAHISLNSVAVLVFTYPNGSLESLINTSYNVSFSLTFNKPSDWAIKFMEGYIKSIYHNVSISNMTIKFSLIEHANSTVMIIYKNTSIDLWLTGIFNKTSNGTEIDMAWRSINIKGHFDVSYNNEEYDLNDILSDMNDKSSFIFKFINNNEIDTINFSALSKPLSQWNKIYNPSTNTTIFYYNASSYLLLNATLNDYSLKIIYDPSSTIVTPGYAIATNNSILVYSNSPVNYMNYIYVAIAVIVVIGIISAIFYKNKNKK